MTYRLDHRVIDYIWRGLIGVDDGLVYLVARRPSLPVRLPPNVIRFRRPRPAPDPQPPPLPPAA